MKLILLSLILISCASKSKHMVSHKAEHFVSPGGSIDAEIMIQKDSKNMINPQSAITRLVLKPGAVVPPHTHSSDEYLHFEKGNGEMKIGEETIQLKDRMTVFIPKGTKHSYVNNSKRKSTAIQVYTPAGPEQRFKKWKDDL